MNTRKNKNNRNEMDVQVMIGNIHSEIKLEGSELLKLEYVQPGARVMCTAGALWLTQPGDPHDHLLKAGQSFTLDRHGTILVQGLPHGKTLILEPAKESRTHPLNGAGQWDNPIGAR